MTLKLEKPPSAPQVALAQRKTHGRHMQDASKTSEKGE